MAPKYTGVSRFRGVDGNASAVAQYEGRKLLAEVMAQVKGGRNHVRMQKTLPDGTVVEAMFNGNLPIVTITPPLYPLPKQQKVYPLVWVPRGFVVYPATDLAPYGWGTPIIPDSSGLPYATSNIAPGLDVTRWTAGGKLGQVLLTRVQNAGYPLPLAQQIAPIMFNPRYGPSPIPNPQVQIRVDIAEDQASGNWSAYRLEHNPFIDQAHTLATQSRRAMFELTNAHRVGIGRDPMLLPIRGYYSAAQTYADMQAAVSIFGHYAPQFYPTFYTPGDRNAKDGVCTIQTSTYANNRDFYDGQNENDIATAASLTEVGPDPNGEFYYGVTGLQAMTPQDAFAGWLASPPHKATIENVTWDGNASCLDIGNANVWAQDFTQRNQWIQCGNAFWYSGNPEIPALSWNSFKSMNLAYETWPVAIDSSTLNLTYYYKTIQYGASGTGWKYSTVVLDEENSNTISRINALTLNLSVASIVDTQGIFYQKYYDRTGTDIQSVTVALTSSIFMRGRCIGIVPNGGLVLGAAIQKLQPGKYRLVVIAHVDADQPTDRVANGAMAVVHVYCCDLDDIAGFAAHNEVCIKGIRGMPVSTYPWALVDDPWAWRDCGTVDVSKSGDSGATPDLLKYGCLWRFNASGTQAACIRNQNTLYDFKKMISTPGDWINTAFLLANYTLPTNVASTSSIAYSGFSGTFATSYNPRVLLLDIPAATGLATATLTVKPVPPLSKLVAYNAIPLSWPTLFERNHASSGGVDRQDQTIQFGQHIAVDYDVHGALSLISTLNLLPGFEYTDAPILGFIQDSTLVEQPGTTVVSGAAAMNATIVARGGFDAAYFSDFDSTVMTTQCSPFESGQVLVADVVDFAFAHEGLGAMMQLAIRHSPPDPDAVVFTPTSDYGAGCWISSNAFYVSVYRGGLLLNKQHWVNAKSVGINTDLYATMASYGVSGIAYVIGIETPVCPSAVTQMSYGRNRQGDWVIGYQVSPQPYLTSILSPPAGYTPLPVDFLCAPLPPLSDNSDCRGFLPSDLAPYGGWCKTSFSEQSDFSTMMMTQGANLRLISCGVV